MSFYGFIDGSLIVSFRAVVLHPFTLAVLVASGWAAAACAAPREELEPGVSAVVLGGKNIFVEFHLPEGDAAKELLAKYLVEADAWKSYKNRLAVAVPFSKLSDQARRSVLETLFPDDTVDEQGWWHVVKFTKEEGTETWGGLAVWFTGAEGNVQAIRASEANKDVPEALVPGQKVLIPRESLPEPFRAFMAKATSEDKSVIIEAEKDLKYGKDDKGEYVEYVLKKSETIYGGVVARFTDYHENKDMMDASKTIMERSGIKDARKIGDGQKVRIPLDLLSDRYKPSGSAERTEYDAVDQEARRLQAERVRSKDLDGVVLVLDPGHGGRDQGAAVNKAGLYEDELNYDIVCRVKRLLETKTRAKIYITMKDLSDGYQPRELKRFVHDTDEVVLSTPNYLNEESHFSANLRAYLVNSIYRKELAAKTDPRKVLFVSFHCDAIPQAGMRGTMVYVPGAKYCQGGDIPSGGAYNKYEEARGQGNLKISAAECLKNEALSRNFAKTLVDSLQRSKPPIKVHSSGIPIRNVIVKSRNHAFVPAVLRYSQVHTKVLIEMANLLDSTDQQRLADPQWRERYAAAFVDAVKKYYGN